jgi:NCS1 family nucleobase:cation symporter-1
MVADYYLICRRRLSVPDLYRVDSQYRYSGGFNWPGLIAWIIAGAVAAWWSQYAVLIGFPLGVVLYVLLMRAIVLPNHRQAEIDDGFSDRFLATSGEASWADIAGSHRLGREDI